LGEAPATDPKLRAELESKPLPELLQELAERDPITHETIDRQNPRRVIRAVEVIRLTGRPFSKQRANWNPAFSSPHPASRFLCLSRSTTDLHARIEARVDEMFQRGLVKETRELLERGLALNPTAMQAIGYRQVIEHLHGERSLAETIALVKTRTRQFAKRQMTWFRKQAGIAWIELAPTDSANAIVDQLNLN
jgi:tRNA dimethylallyltransferase